MASHRQLLYHIVFSTKERRPLLQDDIFRESDWRYMAGVTKKLKGHALRIGGYYDHAHLMVRIPAKIAVANFVRQLKANTSEHINEERNAILKLHWQDGYGGFTASRSKVDPVVKPEKVETRKPEKGTGVVLTNCIVNKPPSPLFSPTFVFSEATDLSDEPESILEMYGPDAKTPGSFAANCIQARRLAERGVRFIQLLHQDWDHHGGLPGQLPGKCKETDQPAAALVQDLKQRGMLDDTLVIWGGEFGRTNYCQGPLTAGAFGRDHHPRCFSMWMAGGGIAGGRVYGETDPFGYNIAESPVHVDDLQATIMHALGIDHTRLTFKYQGRRFRLTDVHGEVIHDWFG